MLWTLCLLSSHWDSIQNFMKRNSVAKIRFLFSSSLESLLYCSSNIFCVRSLSYLCPFLIIANENTPERMENCMKTTTNPDSGIMIFLLWMQIDVQKMFYYPLLACCCNAYTFWIWMYVYCFHSTALFCCLFLSMRELKQWIKRYYTHNTIYFQFILILIYSLIHSEFWM